MAAAQSYGLGIPIQAGRNDRLSPGPEAILSQRAPSVTVSDAPYLPSTPESTYSQLSGSARSSTSNLGQPCPTALDSAQETLYAPSSKGAQVSQPHLNAPQSETPMVIPGSPNSSLPMPAQPGLAASYYDASDKTLSGIVVDLSGAVDVADLPADANENTEDRGLFSRSSGPGNNSKTDKYTKKGAEFVKKQIKKQIKKKMHGGGGGNGGGNGGEGDSVWDQLGDALGEDDGQDWGQDGGDGGDWGDYGFDGSGLDGEDPGDWGNMDFGGGGDGTGEGIGEVISAVFGG